MLNFRAPAVVEDDGPPGGEVEVEAAHARDPAEPQPDQFPPGRAVHPGDAEGGLLHGGRYESGIRSRNQKESLRTLSPTENLTSSLNSGPPKTKVWNSPFSPQGS